MGGNCSGKTTVLQALACVYQPSSAQSTDYRFPSFFRPNTGSHWEGSDFEIAYSQRIGQQVYDNLTQRYEKASDRWTPRYQRRPVRDVRYVGIGESVPDIDRLTLKSMIHYTTIPKQSQVEEEIRKAAGQILNRDYQSFFQVNYNYTSRVSIGVSSSNVTYSGLSMSSGEQRVFRILESVYRSPKFSLILIDEIDLFLHQDALQRLLQNLNAHCSSKNKQLVFTTHFPPVADMYKEIQIYTLNRVPDKTVVWPGYSIEAMRHITGKQLRPLSCYVEDDLAEAIVSRVATDLQIRKTIEIGRYGPAANAFSLSTGLYLSKYRIDDTLVLLDGDVYGDIAERRQQVKKALSGNQSQHDNQRKDVLKMIRALAPRTIDRDVAIPPEVALHRLIRTISPAKLSDARVELYELVNGINNVQDTHEFLDLVIDHVGEPRQVALFQLVELASLADGWVRYTRPLRRWMCQRKTFHKL